MGRPTKTFGLHTPSDLLYKLQSDIDRLAEPAVVWSRHKRYAAIDCAVSCWSLVDWTLRSVTEQRRSDLCGARGGTRGFVETNSHRIPHLAHCQQIANAAKHLVLDRMPEDPLLSAVVSVRFDRPFQADAPETWNDLKASTYAHIVVDGVEHEAVGFFRAVQHGWARFLQDEGLLRDLDPEAQNVFA